MGPSMSAVSHESGAAAAAAAAASSAGSMAGLSGCGLARAGDPELEAAGGEAGARRGEGRHEAGEAAEIWRGEARLGSASAVLGVAGRGRVEIEGTGRNLRRRRGG